MPKIRVDTTYTVIDGSEVVFTAPCNCSEIEGLKVYYPDGSKEFTFKDAHGNALTGIGEAFAKGALVKVILDVTNSFAYIQNADTNSYIETTKAAVPKSVTGSVLAVKDSIHASLAGLTIYGKTTQNGTPTPENPVELVSAGASGAINVSVRGKNLYGIDKETFVQRLTATMDVPFPAGTYTVSGMVVSDDTDSMSCLLGLFSADESLKEYVTFQRGVQKSYTVTVDFPIGKVRLMASSSFGNSAGDSCTWSNVQIEQGATATQYESLKPSQTLTAETPDGLPGIPVSKGGNYTDETGQQWICDYKDYFNGVYVKMVNVVDAASLPWKKSTNFFYASLPLGGRNVLCNSYPCVGVYTDATVPSTDKIITLYAKLNGIRINDSRYTDVSSFVASLDGAKIAYPLETPVETPLSAEEMEQYLALHTNNPNTTIFNDSGADMKVEYHSQNAAVPMNLGSCKDGHLLSVDEHGCVTTVSKRSLPYAPSGYGLGHPWCKEAYSWEELDTALNGWDYLDTDTAGTGAASGITKGLVRVSSEAGRYGVQELYPSWSGEKLERRLNEYEWDEWEWVNPPMELGVEYRTTERWMDKPVYVKAVDCGTLPNNGSKTVSTGSNGYFRPVKIEARRPIVGGDEQEVQKLPIISGNDVLADGFMYGSGVRIVTTSDMSDYTAIATVKYTKN